MRQESLFTCPNDGRGGKHNFVRCSESSLFAFSCSHCGAAIQRGTHNYLQSGETALLRAALAATETTEPDPTRQRRPA